MYLQDVLIYYQKSKFINCLPVCDPYKASIRQCTGKCPYQKFTKIVK